MLPRNIKDVDTVGCPIKLSKRPETIASLKFPQQHVSWLLFSNERFHGAILGTGPEKVAHIK